MKKISITICVLILFLGCASPRNSSSPVSASNAAALKNKTVTFTHRTTPGFIAQTASGVALGALGGGLGAAFAAEDAIKEGTELINGAEVQDPAIQIRESIAAFLAEEYGMEIVENSIPISDKEKIKETVDAFDGFSGYLIVIDTVVWGCRYIPLKFGRYYAFYYAKFKLVDLERRKIVARGYYQRRIPEEEGNPTYDELFENDAVLLKDYLRIVTDEATALFIGTLEQDEMSPTSSGRE